MARIRYAKTSDTRSAYETDRQAVASGDVAGAVEQAEDRGDVGDGLRDLRDAHARGDALLARVVGGQRERHGAEAAQQVAHQVRLRVDGRVRIERVAQPVRVRGRRHELRDALRPGAGDPRRVEAGRLVQLRGQQGGRDA